ncbi:MAG TPA: hypothetical protein VK501_16290 [Baekduia sp.]|uniref:hypothetical protein n=1 Tax=Baekduia sp. TaxID=2600305 RepID=UPI002D1C30B4|nr:hypothetical protein [Baekduia sp.]HMJ35469.1 hypothetical protein [Baekduia sp.]
MSEVLASGHSDRTVEAGQDPAKAMLEQRTAMTPQAHPGPTAGEGSAIAMLPWWVVIGVMIVSVGAAPSVSQGWILPLIIVRSAWPGWPCSTGWHTPRPPVAHARPVKWSARSGDWRR